MVLVMVVPTFAPIIMGMALCNVMDPEATSATTIAVVVELLWIIAVISNPMNSAVNGLDVAWMMVSAAGLLMCWSDVIIKSSAKTNKASIPTMYKTVVTFFRETCGVCMGTGFSKNRQRYANHLPGCIP